MKHLIRYLLALGCVSAPVWAAIDGTVLNKTSGKPQAGVSVTLVKPGQGGMQTLGSTTSDAMGHFAFSQDEPGGGPQLLQANYGGVNYNKLLTPNIPRSGVELDVFEATSSTAVARIAERMLVFEPTLSQIGVNETVVLQNNSNQTFRSDKTGELQFYLPPAANGQVRINAQGPQGMPLPRAAEKTERSNVFKINFPIKPGETEFQIAYVLPAGSPFTFRSETVNLKGMISPPLRLVAPAGVTLSGKDVQQLGVEPNTKATIFNVLRTGGYSVDIAGTGSLNGGTTDATASGPSDDESPKVTEGRPKIYEHMGWLLGLALTILGVGVVVLYRTSPVRT